MKLKTSNKKDEQYYSQDYSDYSDKKIASDCKILELTLEAERLVNLGYKSSNFDKAVRRKKFSVNDIEVIKGILMDYEVASNKKKRRRKKTVGN